LVSDEKGRAASAKRWTRATIDIGDKASIEKGRTVKGIDHSLWEREIAEYISLHPDLEDLPPPKFPRRRSRLGRRFGFTGRLAESGALVEADGHQPVTY
jgi:hypothetical protein